MRICSSHDFVVPFHVNCFVFCINVSSQIYWYFLRKSNVSALTVSASNFFPPCASPFTLPRAPPDGAAATGAGFGAGAGAGSAFFSSTTGAGTGAGAGAGSAFFSSTTGAGTGAGAGAGSAFFSSTTGAGAGAAFSAFLASAAAFLAAAAVYSDTV